MPASSSRATSNCGSVQDEEKRYQIAKDLSDNLTISYNTSEVVMARLQQTTSAKERIYAQSITFFSTNDTVLTALKASFTGMFGLHESTATLNAMKEGMSKSLETLSEVGGKVQEEAVKAGYGPTIRADAVKKLVDSVVNYQERAQADHRGDAQGRDPELGRDPRRGRGRQAADREARRRRQGAPALMARARTRSRRGRRGGAAPPATLDEVMLAMDVVDTLRHRERLVERELNEELSEEQLIERLRALYKSQGIEVPDRIIAEGVKALKESRFVYTPPQPGFRRSLAMLWVRRGRYGKWAAGVAYCAARRKRSPSIRCRAAARAAPPRLRASSSPRRCRASWRRPTRQWWRRRGCRRPASAPTRSSPRAVPRSSAATPPKRARRSPSSTGWRPLLRQEYVLRIAGRPEDETGFFREHPSFQGRAYFVVVDAIDPGGNPVRLPIRNDETNEVETVSRFAVRVPIETFDAVRNDKAKNGIVQNARLAEKRRGFLEPEFRMAVLEGRITRW